MKIVAPFRGEFGIKLRYHVPRVHALPGPKIVLAEEGEDCLYPSAESVISVPRSVDFARRDTYESDRAYVDTLKCAHPNEWVETGPGMPESRFVPDPSEVDTLTVPESDVLICPRRRKYGPNKNWDLWHGLVPRLEHSGKKVVAAGAPDSSQWIERVPYSWDHARYGSHFLAASIAFMLKTKVVVSTDSGLAHLAILCGRPLVLIAADGGRVAPGPVYGDHGEIIQDRYWRVRLKEYYHDANHLNAPICFLPYGWNDVDMVERAARDMIES